MKYTRLNDILWMFKTAAEASPLKPSGVLIKGSSWKRYFMIDQKLYVYIYNAYTISRVEDD